MHDVKLKKHEHIIHYIRVYLVNHMRPSRGEPRTNKIDFEKQEISSFKMPQTRGLYHYWL